MSISTATATVALTRGAHAAGPDVSSPWADISPPANTAEVERLSRWDKIIRKIHAMLTLSDDWDGMGASPPPWSIVFSAVELACAFRAVHDYPAPTRVTPTPAGTIGLEWQEPSVYTEAEIVALGQSEWMQIKDGEQPVHWTVNGIPDINIKTCLEPNLSGTIGQESQNDSGWANSTVLLRAW